MEEVAPEFQRAYSVQANVKTLEGPQHPDRNARFRYINPQEQAFRRTRDAVLSHQRPLAAR